jgi:hypothetical protein
MPVTTSLETWVGEVLLCPTSVQRQFKRSLSTNDVDGATVEGSGRRKDAELFPMSVTVTVDGNGSGAAWKGLSFFSFCWCWS